MTVSSPRLLMALLVTSLPVLLVSALFSPTQARTPIQRAGTPAHSARALPQRAARSSLAALGAAPAAVFPATMSEDFEGAWPGAGWTLQDYRRCGRGRV